MGKAGATVNTIALAYLLVAFIFTFFPQVTPVTPTTMNWMSLIYGSVLIFALT